MHIHMYVGIHRDKTVMRVISTNILPTRYFRSQSHMLSKAFGIQCAVLRPVSISPYEFRACYTYMYIAASDNMMPVFPSLLQRVP